jgi:hypothetical protein
MNSDVFILIHHNLYLKLVFICYVFVLRCREYGAQSHYPYKGIPMYIVSDCVYVYAERTDGTHCRAHCCHTLPHTAAHTAATHCHTLPHTANGRVQCRAQLRALPHWHTRITAHCHTVAHYRILLHTAAYCRTHSLPNSTKRTAAHSPT